jgi:hypothetical protein
MERKFSTQSTASMWVFLLIEKCDKNKLTLTCKGNFKRVLCYLVPNNIFMEVPTFAVPLHISLWLVSLSEDVNCSMGSHGIPYMKDACNYTAQAVCL